MANEPDITNAASELLVTITIAPDGQTFFSDLPADLLAVASELAPTDQTLESRRQAASKPTAPSD